MTSMAIFAWNTYVYCSRTRSKLTTASNSILTLNTLTSTSSCNETVAHNRSLLCLYDDQTPTLFSVNGVPMEGMTMNALVVYDSLYGNTEKIAQVVAAVLETFGPTRVQPVADVSSIPPDTDLLVVGGPTHGHAVNAGITSFLERVDPSAVSGIAVTAFDTRVDWPVLLSGSAARGISKQLRRKGGNVIVEPASFLVDGREGPLKDGELERANSWAQQIVNAVRAQ